METVSQMGFGVQVSGFRFQKTEYNECKIDNEHGKGPLSYAYCDWSVMGTKEQDGKLF